MTDTIRLVDYFYVLVPDKPGEGLAILKHLRDEGVNLLGFSGFPEARKAQLDFLPADPAAFKAAMRKMRIKPVGPKKGFLLSGEDRVGALADILSPLVMAKVNVTAVDAICAPGGQFTALLWVKPREVRRAAKAFGIG
jgi:hypothetical protein